MLYIRLLDSRHNIYFLSRTKNDRIYKKTCISSVYSNSTGTYIYWMTIRYKYNQIYNYFNFHPKEPIITSPQKIKLARKSTSSSSSGVIYINLLKQSKSSNEALQLLLRVTDSLQIDESDIPDILLKLREHFLKENESAVRVKIISLIGDIGSEAISCMKILIDETINLIQNETSSKVIAQALSTLLRYKFTNIYLNV